nr:SNF2-related, N-terminal domain-containing protein [Tanacetum cinerariifolium]
MANKRKAASVTNKKLDPSVPTSKGGAPHTNMRKKAKLRTVDEPSVQQVPSQERGFYQSLEAEARAQFQAKELSQEKLNQLVNCLEASLAICSICNDPPEDAVVTKCEHVFCNQCIREHLSSDDSQCPSSECKELLSGSTVFCKSTLKICISDDVASSGSVKSEDLEPSSSNGPIDSLKIEATKALESSKIKAALEVLQSISKPDDITRFLHGWRLDGTMSVVARDKAVKDFNTLPEVTVMIMSLKAASLGLNMVAACHVILLDLWWNPTTEDQAIDRAHRIGQTRPVTVFRFTVKDTIEDRILDLQQRKREMVESVFGDDKNGGCEPRLTVADMEYLAHRIGQTRPVTVFRFTVKDTIEDRILDLQQWKREMVESVFGDDKNGGCETRLTVADMEYLFQA